MAADPNETSSESLPSTEETSELNHTDTSDHFTNSQMPHDCTVCQNAPISRVILPCRHACICTGCFPLVTRCPMCRGVIHSFFSMGNDSYQHDLLNRPEGERDWMARIEDGCERLNQWLGFNQNQ